MSLFHIFFKPYSPEVIKNNKEYRKIIDFRDSTQIALLNNLKGRSISIDEYHSKMTELLAISKKEVKRVNNEKRKINRAFSFRGRSSFRLWIFMFGLVSLGFLFSCKSLYHDIVNGSTYRTSFISISGIFVSLFWVIHLTFLTHKDFNQSNYIILIVVCSLLSTFFTYYLVKYYSYKDVLIVNLLDFIGRVKKNHFKDMAVKSMYAEKTGKALRGEKSVSQSIKEFDSDLAETIKDV